MNTPDTVTEAIDFLVSEGYVYDSGSGAMS